MEQDPNVDTRLRTDALDRALNYTAIYTSSSRPNGDIVDFDSMHVLQIAGAYYEFLKGETK